MHYLMSYPVDKNQACTVLQSAARDTLIQLSQTTSESTATALREGNFEFFLDQLPSGDEYKLDQMSYNKVELYRRTIFNVICRTKPDGKCSIHRDELYIIFNHTVGGMSASPTTFTKFLGHRQIEIRPVTIDSKTVRGIQTTWSDLTSIPQQLKTYFSDFKVKA
jgi:hypothetical protein